MVGGARPAVKEDQDQDHDRRSRSRASPSPPARAQRRREGPAGPGGMPAQPRSSQRPPNHKPNIFQSKIYLKIQTFVLCFINLIRFESMSENGTDTDG